MGSKEKEEGSRGNHGFPVLNDADPWKEERYGF
jgi:hypothetical protein